MSEGVVIVAYHDGPHISPKPFNPLIVDTFPCDVTSLFRASLWMLQHVPGDINIFPTLVAPDTVWQTMFSDSTDKALENSVRSVVVIGTEIHYTPTESINASMDYNSPAY